MGKLYLNDENVFLNDGEPYTGKGTYKWDNGDSYEGDFLNGQRTGIGKYTWANGSFYVGDVKDGKHHGKGKLTWSSGEIYEGDFFENNMTGKGKITWTDGSYYVGDFQSGGCQGIMLQLGQYGKITKIIVVHLFSPIYSFCLYIKYHKLIYFVKRKDYNALRNT